MKAPEVKGACANTCTLNIIENNLEGKIRDFNFRTMRILHRPKISHYTVAILLTTMSKAALPLLKDADAQPFDNKGGKRCCEHSEKYYDY